LTGLTVKYFLGPDQIRDFMFDYKNVAVLLFGLDQLETAGEVMDKYVEFGSGIAKAAG
jgi:hypothetical protein